MKTVHLEPLRTKFHYCSRLSAEKGEGARQLLQMLDSAGGTILLLKNGPVHDNPQNDIDANGSILVCPGLAHPLLSPDAHFQEKSRDASCSFGYINDSRTFDFSQSAKASKSNQVDAVMRGQVALAESFYAELQPAYGWIDEMGENEPSTKSIANADLKYIFWANFLGPAYVNRYGRDFLLNAPGWRKEELDDGGILYVVHESYMHWRTTEATDVLDYFRSKVPEIRQYRTRGFERTEAILEGRIKPNRTKRKRRE